MEIPFVDSLVRASLQGALAVALVWLVCRLAPRLPAALRCGLWWLACLKLVFGLAWGLAWSLEWAAPVRLPLLPAAAAAPVGASSPALPAAAPMATPASVAAPSATSPRELPWRPAALALWGAGILSLLGETLAQHRRARRAVRWSTAAGAPAEALFAELRGRLGVARRTAVRCSAAVTTPQVLGLLRPVVLLPAAAVERLSPAELAMTLCHELVHLRRGDLWLAWVPALAQRLFFFHPLAHLAAREYLLAREAACDAEVLRVLSPAPESYGRLLVRLGVTPRVPRLAAAGAAPSFQILKRRLQMLQHAKDAKRVHPGWWALIALAALVGLVPFTITAQEAPPAPPAVAEAPEAPEPPEAPAALPAPAPRAPLPPARVAQNGRHSVPPVPPVPPQPPVPPRPPRPPHYGYHYAERNGESYVFLYDDHHSTMSGSTGDIERARRARGSASGPIFWFERGGKEYVIRDAATLQQIKALFEPQQKLGEQQGALGEKQGKLGAQQGALGAKQARHGAEQAGLGAKMAGLAAQEARLDQEGKSTAAVEAQMKDLEAQMKKLAEPQEELGRQQEELGRQQEALGRQQEELGRQQEKAAAEAERQLKTVVDRALANGTAQQVK